MSDNQLDMIDTDETGAIPTEQAEFLKSLEAEEQAESYDPEQAEAEAHEAAQQAEMDEQTAQMTATMGLATMEFALKRVIHPEFAFTHDTKAYAVENLGPVLIKYGALLPGWLAAYDAEIKACMAVGKLVSEGIDTAKELKTKEVEQKGAQDSEKERVRVAV